MTATTPADLTVTASTSTFPNNEIDEYLQLTDPSGNLALGFVTIAVDEVSSNYVPGLNVSSASYATNPMTDISGELAPGALFYIGLSFLAILPSGSAQASPSVLASTLAGYSFKMSGLTVPLRSYSSGQFLAQIPVGLQPGNFDLDAFDTAGNKVATGSVTLVSPAPAYLSSLPNGFRAQKTDGSVVNPGNPVRSGDSILVSLTGQGTVSPPIVSGVAASPGSPSTPLLPVSAAVGGKVATVLSATMSTSEAGVLNVWIEVPELTSGDHNVAVSVGAASAGNLPISVATGTAVPQIGEGGVVNAASFVANVAPGSLFSIFGSGLSPSVLSATQLPLATTLGQVSVTIGGKAAPLLYVSGGQINGQVPYEIGDSSAAPVVVTVNGVSSAPGTAPVVSAAPGIFEFGQGRAVAQNQDHSLNNTDNGAAVGSVIVIYLTGSGKPDNPVVTGAPAPTNPLAKVVGQVTVTIGGAQADVSFAGLTPGFVGLLQVNAKVPNLAAGTYPLVASINDEKSNSALVTVK